MAIADTFPSGLRPQQVVGALTIVQKRRHLLADQPGAGKTAQALVATELDGLLARPSAILITTTMTACQLTWADELAHRVAGQYDVVIADLTNPGLNKRTGLPKKTLPSVADRNEQLGAARLEAQLTGLPLIVLANFELLRWKIGQPKAPLSNLFEINFDAVIVDESHLVLPTMVDQDQKLSQFWYGLKRLRTTENPILLPISGPPDREKLHHRYGTWKFLYPSGHHSFWNWCRANFVVNDTDWGGADIGKLMRPEHWAKIDRERMTRRTKAEMLKGLPPKQWAGDGGIELPMTAAQAEAYQDFQADLAAEQEELMATGDEKDAQKASALKMQFFLRSRQMATCTWTFTESYDNHGNKHVTGKPIVAGPGASNKLTWLLGWLEARGYTPENWDPSLGKVVIVSYFTEVLGWLQQELQNAGIESAIIAGPTSQPDKVAIEARFQRGDLRIVLLSGYMGVSINLDAADDMVFVDSIHDPDKMEQAEDRIHRASRNHQVTYWRLASLHTTDIVVLQTVDTRYRETRKTYDGDRGVEFARKMLPKMAADRSSAA